MVNREEALWAKLYSEKGLAAVRSFCGDCGEQACPPCSTLFRWSRRAGEGYSDVCVCTWSPRVLSKEEEAVFAGYIHTMQDVETPMQILKAKMLVLEKQNGDLQKENQERLDRSGWDCWR